VPGADDGDGLEVYRHRHDQTAGVVGVLADKIDSGRRGECVPLLTKLLLMKLERLLLLHLHSRTLYS
jgi:hypothetical protein